MSRVIAMTTDHPQMGYVKGYSYDHPQMGYVLGYLFSLTVSPQTGVC